MINVALLKKLSWLDRYFMIVSWCVFYKVNKKFFITVYT